MDYSSEFKSELKMAKKCMGYGMCKTNFLGNGICESGLKKFYAAYYPQGRMRMFADFISGNLPVTERLVDIVDSCNLCGICNLQCYYVSENTPVKVMTAMKKVLKERLKQEKIIKTQEDDILKELRAVVGQEFAADDPAILSSYSANDRNVLSLHIKIPDYVVLPESTQQVAEIIKIADKHSIKFLPRSTGSYPMILLNGGIIIDLCRMKKLEIDSDNLCAAVGAGITAFELQKAAHEKGLRMAIGESSACVCANMMCSGIQSMFSSKYGLMSDVLLNAQLVTPQGNIINSNSAEFKEIFDADRLKSDPPSVTSVCTEVKIKLFEIEENETVVFLPFKEYKETLTITREIAENSIGSGNILLSIELFSDILTLTELDAINIYDITNNYLKINYCLFVFCRTDEIEAVEKIACGIPVVRREAVNRVIKGVPAITGPESMFLIEDVMYEDEPYKLLFGRMLDYFLNAIDIEPEDLPYVYESAPDKKLGKALCELHEQPVFGDILYWLDYRPMSPRLGRKFDILNALYFCSFENIELIEILCGKLKETADKYKIINSLCHITPLDKGKRLLLEYDFYFPRGDKKAMKTARKVYFEANKSIEELASKNKGIFSIRKIALKGLSDRKRLLHNL